MKNQRINGELWPDDNGVPLNAHGAGILFHGNLYYLYGEHKIEGRAGNRAWVGIHVYSSPDLIEWTDRGIAFDIAGTRQDPRLIPGECILERPKVIYCAKTGKFVMFIHAEFDRSYSAASVAVAVADAPVGPFRLLKIERPSIGRWAENTPAELKDPARIQKIRDAVTETHFYLTPEEVKAGSVLGYDLEKGQQSRDFTVFADDDGTAYLIHSSENNSTVHIVRLDETCTMLDGPYWRVFPMRWMEAPAVFKHHGRYYFIGSGCTGWAPNAARSAVADHIRGPWTELGNPCSGPDAETTYGGQTAYAQSLPDGSVLMLLDRWCPENAIDGRYLWLPVVFDGERPLLPYRSCWFSE